MSSQKTQHSDSSSSTVGVVLLDDVVFAHGSEGVAVPQTQDVQSLVELVAPHQAVVLRVTADPVPAGNSKATLLTLHQTYRPTWKSRQKFIDGVRYGKCPN